MRKYKIGLIVLSLIALGLLVFVVTQAAGYKTDKNTYDKAAKIARDLNEFVDKNQIVPESLSDVTSVNIPETIRYEKISSSKYRFCVTYNQADDSMVEASPMALVMMAAYGLRQSPMEGTDSGYSSAQEPELYIYPWHEAGEDCQTVVPYLYNSYDYPKYDMDAWDQFQSDMQNGEALQPDYESSYDPNDFF